MGAAGEGVKLVVAAAIAVTVEAQEWNRFRGPNGTSVHATAKGLPVSFDPAKAAWKAPVPFGQSSPVIAGGKIFLTGTEGGKLTSLAFDAATGRELWRRQMTRPRTPEMYRLNDPASPTPAADASQVYFFFPDFGLVAYDHWGNERWRVPLGPFHNFYGQAGSPIVEGDRLILNCDQQTGSFLIALDKRTGKQLWRRDRPGIIFGWTTPIVHNRQVIVVSTDRTDAYSVVTGEPEWQFRMASEGAMGSPVVFENSLIVHANGSDQPSPETYDKLLAANDADKDGKITAAEIVKHPFGEHFPWMDSNRDGVLSGAEWDFVRNFNAGDNGILAVPLGRRGLIPPADFRWRFKRNVPYVPAPVLYQNTLFMVRSGGVMTTIDPATGALHKQGRLDKALGSYLAQPVAGDGKVYFVNGEGVVSTVKAQAQWEVMAVSSLGEEVQATPAAGDGVVYIRTREHLYSFR
jgi:outer membrane protein assembly factor BamB